MALDTTEKQGKIFFTLSNTETMSNNETEQGRPIRTIVKESDGAVFVEYIIVVAFFGLVVGAAVFALGKPLMRFFVHAQLIWSGPFP